MTDVNPTRKLSFWKDQARWKPSLIFHWPSLLPWDQPICGNEPQPGPNDIFHTASANL